MQCWNGKKDSKDKWATTYSQDFDRVKSGTIIKMIYNVGKGSVSFIVDGKNHGIAFDNVDKREDLNYRLAIYMNTGASVELLGVSITSAL